MPAWSWKAALAGGAIVAASVYAFAQMPSGHHDMATGMGEPANRDAAPEAPHGPAMMRMMMDHAQGMHGPHGGPGMMGHRHAADKGPHAPGQDAFGAIQEVVQILEADRSTDWSRVSIAALREHLIDMNEVTLRAAADERPLPDGIEILVTGEGRTLDAIKRMVPAHGRELTRIGWNVTTEELPNGVKLVARSGEPNEAKKLKALGFMGIMVQGSHHQPHHLLLAKGELSAH